MTDKKTFDFYKEQLEQDLRGDKQVRYCGIQYLCYFPDIDADEMAVAIRKDGFNILFDDSAISTSANVSNRRRIEKKLKSR